MGHLHDCVIAQLIAQRLQRPIVQSIAQLRNRVNVVLTSLEFALSGREGCIVIYAIFYIKSRSDTVVT
jgi:hypothetical protein